MGAATQIYDRLHELYPGKTSAQLWGMIGVTEDLGMDDFGPAETFTLADAHTVEQWAAAKGLADAAIIGAVGFVLFVGLGTWVMAADAPLRYAGKAAQAVRNRVLRKREPIAGLPERLVEQRDLIRSVLGQQWWQATLLSAGRLGFDYLCLLFSVRAVGAHPRPSLVLLAYAVAGIIGLVPITPGGLGIVEASLSGLLVLAGLDGAQAVLATLAYRLASYWLPLMSGPFAYALFKRRYRDPRVPPALAAGTAPT